MRAEWASSFFFKLEIIISCIESIAWMLDGEQRTAESPVTWTAR
jgi:hypothetical protein